MWSTPRDRQRAAGEHCWHVVPHREFTALEAGSTHIKTVEVRRRTERCCFCRTTRDVTHIRQEVPQPDHGPYVPVKLSQDWQLVATAGGTERCPGA